MFDPIVLRTVMELIVRYLSTTGYPIGCGEKDTRRSLLPDSGI